MIVRQFISWIRTAPAGERAEATRALARAWLISDLTEDDRIVAEGALLMLLDDPSPLVRQAMAEVFAYSAEAPAAIVQALAADQPAIALPVTAYVEGPTGLVLAYGWVLVGLILWRVADGLEGAARDLGAGALLALLALAPLPLEALVALKALAHWLTTGLPLVVADAADEAALRKMCLGTRALVSTVGSNLPQRMFSVTNHASRLFHG